MELLQESNWSGLREEGQSEGRNDMRDTVSHGNVALFVFRGSEGTGKGRLRLPIHLLQETEQSQPTQSPNNYN